MLHGSTDSEEAKEKQKTVFDNVHFLHLECNTLPENKSWIMGCQCEFCLNEEQKEDKNKHYLKYIEDDIYSLAEAKANAIHFCNGGVKDSLSKK